MFKYLLNFYPKNFHPKYYWPGAEAVQSEEFRSRGQPGTVIMFPTWKEIRRWEEEELMLILAALD